MEVQWIYNQLQCCIVIYIISLTDLIGGERNDLDNRISNRINSDPTRTDTALRTQETPLQQGRYIFYITNIGIY